MDGSALAGDAGLRAAVGRGARAAGVLALLARPAGEGPHRLLPERLVLAAARRSRPPAAAPRRVRRQPRRDRRFRARADRRRRTDPEVLDAPRQAVAGAAAREAAQRSAHALARHARAVGQLEALRPLHPGRRRDHHAHQPRQCSLDDRRGWRRALSEPDGCHRHPRRDPQAVDRAERQPRAGLGRRRARQGPAGVRGRRAPARAVRPSSASST